MGPLARRMLLLAAVVVASLHGGVAEPARGEAAGAPASAPVAAASAVLPGVDRVLPADSADGEDLHRAESAGRRNAVSADPRDGTPPKDSEGPDRPELRAPHPVSISERPSSSGTAAAPPAPAARATSLPPGLHGAPAPTAPPARPDGVSPSAPRALRI